MQISFKLNIKYFLFAIASFVVAYMTATGSILNYINFAGELNEMAFCFFALLLGILNTIMAFERIK
jgi:hypothetical protein